MAKKPKTTRSTIRGARLRDRFMATAPGWFQIRDKFPEGPRELADQIAEHGMTLRDLMALECAEHETIRGMLAEEDSTRVKATLIAAMVQSRKALRALVEASGPTLNLGDQPVVVPIGMRVEDFEALREEVEANPDEILD